MKAVPTS